jgi:hypothetical protein
MISHGQAKYDPLNKLATLNQETPEMGWKERFTGGADPLKFLTK